MRVLSRIAGIHVLTAALLTWILLALGWSELFDLPGFESTRSPSASTLPASTNPPDPIPKEARARGSEPAPELRQPEPTRPEPKRLEPQRTVAAAPPPTAPTPVVEPVRPPSPAPSVVAIVPPEPVRVQPSEVPASPPAVLQPLPMTPPSQPPPAAASKAVEPLRPIPPPPVRVQDSPPAPKATPAPTIALDTRAASPPSSADAAPVPPRAEPPPATTRAPRPAAVPSPPARATNWAPRLRIAGFGPDALATVLDELRRAPDDIPCIVFDRVRFRAGSARPLPGALREIDLIAKVVMAGPIGQIRVGSRIGTSRMTPANRQLAADRGRVLRSALTARGVPAERLSIDTSTAYHTLIGDDLGPIGVPLVPSMGLCVGARA